MSTYTAPLKDMQFALHELAQIDQIAALPGNEEASPDVVSAILEEAGKFASGVLDPLNRVGDTQGAKLADGKVTTAPGFKEAYRQFVESGWNALKCDPNYGGQGLPYTVATAVEEMWHGSNVAFALCPLLTTGAIEALMLCGTPEQKEKFLPNMVSGKWTGTMNLTEPQAGSDLAALRSRAVPQTDGSYRVFGQKIFITFGEQDYTENIIHLVLARTPTAPEGVKGISLFLVPKFLINEDGSLGERNDLQCVSIEHKLGIHASPTCVMSYGDRGGAVGYMIGDENRGLEYMFIMMNLARFSVGLEGVGISERAYQRAVAYARDRVQGKALGDQQKGAIIRHPDIRRMLMDMRAHTEAMRGLTYVVAAAFDHAHSHPDEATRKQSLAFADYMIPIVKGWCTESAQHVTYVGVQVHGGMGFIEETGAAQHYRDARIMTIYEGTTGIQGNDLIGRKTLRDGGRTAAAVGMEIARIDDELAQLPGEAFASMRKAMGAALNAVKTAGEYVAANAQSDTRGVFAGAVPYLELWGVLCGGWVMARAAVAASRLLAAGDPDREFLEAKIITARYFAEHILVKAPGLAREVVGGGASVLALADEAF
ncbi:MAG: acyl-CoA dehydrogenase [Betaproteobacteria bacterium]|nr:acyl-CoA dehydrogenase [Betaproteobacteria bacterium]